MPRYEFCCSECNSTEEFFRPIKEGPPKKVECPGCSGSMYHVMGCNFQLKGDGWPSKELNKGDRELAKAREETDNQLAEDSRNQRIVEDVAKTRREGRKATNQLVRNNPQKWNDYNDAMKKGYRPKEKKSYEIKAMKGVDVSG